MCRTAAALGESGEEEGVAARDKAQSLRQQWDLLHTTVEQRIRLALSYTAFHKKAQNVRYMPPSPTPLAQTAHSELDYQSTIKDYKIQVISQISHQKANVSCRNCISQRTIHTNNSVAIALIYIYFFKFIKLRIAAQRLNGYR